MNLDSTSPDSTSPDSTRAGAALTHEESVPDPTVAARPRGERAPRPPEARRRRYQRPGRRSGPRHCPAHRGHPAAAFSGVRGRAGADGRADAPAQRQGGEGGRALAEQPGPPRSAAHARRSGAGGAAAPVHVDAGPAGRPAPAQGALSRLPCSRSPGRIERWDDNIGGLVGEVPFKTETHYNPATHYISTQLVHANLDASYHALSGAAVFALRHPDIGDLPFPRLRGRADRRSLTDDPARFEACHKLYDAAQTLVPQAGGPRRNRIYLTTWRGGR